MEEMSETNESRDSVSCGTSATGGAVKVYFSYDSETKEAIEAKATFCFELAQKLKLLKDRLNVR